MTPRELKKLKEIVAEAVREELERCMPDLIPLKEAARRYGVSTSFLYHNADRLGRVKLGNKVLFSMRNLELAIRTGLLDSRQGQKAAETSAEAEAQDQAGSAW